MNSWVCFTISGRISTNPAHIFCSPNPLEGKKVRYRAFNQKAQARNVDAKPWLDRKLRGKELYFLFSQGATRQGGRRGIFHCSLFKLLSPKQRTCSVCSRRLVTLAIYFKPSEMLFSLHGFENWRMKLSQMVRLWMLKVMAPKFKRDRWPLY